MLRRRDIHDADTAPVGTFRPAAGDVDQDVPHQLRRDCQEVGAVLPADVTPVHEADKRFVHQRGRLKHVAGPLAPQVPASELAQFRVDERHELVEGRFVPVSPRDEQLCDLQRRSGRRGGG